MGSNPTESIAAHSEPCALYGRRHWGVIRKNRCTVPRKRGWEGLNTTALPPRRVMKSCVRAIQASTGPTTVSDSLRRVTPGTVNISFETHYVSQLETVLDCLYQLATVPAGE